MTSFLPLPAALIHHDYRIIIADRAGKDAQPDVGRLHLLANGQPTTRGGVERNLQLVWCERRTGASNY
jgi:hypothetical protein